jgi:hypothetical protein
VHAGFEFELGERATAADFGDDFLVAAHRAVACGHDLDLPALIGGVALVHAEQIAGEQRRLVAAGAGADFENDVALVHGVLGQSASRNCCSSAARRASSSGFSASAMERISASVAGSSIRLVSPFELALRRAIGLHRLDHRRKLGEFARQLDIGLGGSAAPDRVQRRMAGDKRVEFFSMIG